MTELVAKNIMLDSFVAECNQEKFKKYLTALSSSNKEISDTLIIKSEEDELWVLDITGKTAGINYNLTLRDKTAEIAKFLGKEGGVGVRNESAVLKKAVDLIFFRNVRTNAKTTKEWVTKTATLLTKVKLWPETGRTKFIAVRYEDEASEKADYNHPFIDDLLCLPFDRLVFLQKVEIALNVPEKKSPSHLFVQKASDDIEMAKIVVLEKTNDLGFAITNPVPLATGSVGHIYFKLPGQKTLLNLYGKARNSIPHPEKEGLYLSYFNFFGLNKSTNKEIRAYLARDSGYKNFISQDPSAFTFNHDNIFFTDEQKRKKTIALLDIDESVIKNTTDYIKGEINNVDIVTNDSYYTFYKKYLDKKSDKDRATPATNEDFFSEIVSVLIDPATYNLQMAITPAGEDDKLLGHEAKSIFSEPQGWLNLFDNDFRNLLQECLYLVLTAKRINKNFELMHADGKKRLVAIEFILEETTRAVRLNLKAADSKFVNRPHQLEKIDSLECLIIDYALLPEDFNAFITGLKTGCDNAKISVPPDGPAIIVLANESQKIKFTELLESNIYALVYKPLEVRRILYLATQAIRSPFSLYTEDNIGWKTDNINAKISRPAQLVELSEFGATLKCHQHIKPGTMLYLFKSIFQNAPDQNICVRVYHSEEDESEPGTYLNSVIYFGITDSFLKFTRSYIRETYASAKSKESSQ